MYNKKEYGKKYRQEHKEQLRAYHREYNRMNKGVFLESGRKSRYKLKEEILTYYGNGECRCVRCGFSDIRALTLDHIDGNGGKHRALLQHRSSGYYFYVDLKRQGFPIGYQTLCSNCQRIKQVENREWANVAQPIDWQKL